ncbi:apolipoprotein B receptor [Rhynchocyon petersi]
MDFLRLHLPGLHQALRGALDSFSTFVSYLIGDGVPTAEGREGQAAEELDEVGAGRLKRAVEEEAHQAQERNEELRAPGEAGRCQEESSATEQTWSWREGSSHGSQADRQDTEAWEAAEDAGCQESRAPLETWKESEAGSAAGGDKSSQTPKRQESDEQEVNGGETLRTWEQEEEEEVRAREPGVAKGVESEGTWHREPEGKAAVGWQNEAGVGRETEQVGKEASAEEIQGPEARGDGGEEEVMVLVRGGHVLEEHGAQGPEHEVSAALRREETRTTLGGEKACMASVQEEADHAVVVRETGFGAALGEKMSEGTESVWVLDEASEGDRVMEVAEKREAQESLFPKQAQAVETEGVEEGAESQVARREPLGGHESEEEVEASCEGQEDQSRGEGEGWGDSKVGADQVGPEVAQEEKGESWTAEAGLPRDEAVRGAEDDTDSVAALEVRPEVFTGLRHEEEAHSGWETLKVEGKGLESQITEGQEPELREAAQSPAERLESSHGAREELWETRDLGREELESKLVEDARGLDSAQVDVPISEATAWGDQRREDTRGPDSAQVDVPISEATAWGDQRREDTRGPDGAQVDVPISEAAAWGDQRKEDARGLDGAQVDVPISEAAAWGDQRKEDARGLDGAQVDVPISEAAAWGDQRKEDARGLDGAQVDVPISEAAAWGDQRKEDARGLDGAQVDVLISEAAAWGDQRRRGVETGDTWEEEDAENVKEESAVGAEAEGDQESKAPEAGQTDGERKEEDPWPGAEEEEEALETENQEPAWSCGAQAGTGQLLENPEAREAKDGEVEPAVSWEADKVPRRGWGLDEGVLDLQDSEHVQTRHPLTPQIMEEKAVLDVKEAETEEGPERETGGGRERELKRGWDPDKREEEREEAEGSGEAAEREQECSLEASTEEEMMGEGHRAEAEFRRGESEGDQAQTGECGVAGGSWQLPHFTSGSQVVMGESEGLLAEQVGEGETKGWQVIEQGLEDEEQCGDRYPTGEALGTLDVEGVEIAGGQKPEDEGVREAEETPEDTGDMEGAGEAKEKARNVEEAGEAGEVEAREAEGVRKSKEAEEAGGVEETGELEKAEDTWIRDAEKMETPKEGEEKEAEEVREADATGKAEEASVAGLADEGAAEGLKDTDGQKEQPMTLDHPKAEPEPRGEAEALEATGSAQGDSHSSWSEALLPGSRLDVSVSRSRALLSRSSSQRRSRPSSLRTPVPQPQEEPPSPPPEAELSTPKEQRPIQPEGSPEPSPPRPEGTPVPARRRPLGHGFGLAHSGMMQELQARLGKAKPQ